VVVGRQNLAESADETMAALAAVLAAAPNAKVLPALRRGNVVGALAVGMAPVDDGHDGLATLNAAADGKLDLLILLGVDPINDCPDADLARRALAGARHVVSIDTHLSDSAKQADIVLAAAAYGEKSGTTTNLEGRVSVLADKVTSHGTARPDWMIAAELASMLGYESGLADVTTVDEVTAAIAREVPGFAGVTLDALAADRNGVLAEVVPAPLGTYAHAALQRVSYDYRLVVSRKLYDRAIGTAMSPSIAKLAPGAGAHVHPLDLAQLGARDGDDVRIIGEKSSAIVPVRANPRVARGVVWAPFNQSGATVEDLIDASASVVDVKIEVV
jgi:predicted molibdopterin-dependent oxidoreductase YjgC